ncbi:MAG TPA: hypothetical protein VIT45_08160 [Allosphingosinicella sp.]
MSRVFPAGAALLILAAALALRCWHIANWPLWLDESWSRWMTEQSWSGLWHAASGYDTHPPFYYSLLKAWTGIAPSTPFWLRFPSLIASLLMLPLAWACAGQIGALRRAPGARIIAVMLIAVSPPLIVAAGQARPYALLALAFGIALWAGIRLLRTPTPTPTWRIWLVYLLGIEATLWLHSLAALFVVALGVGLLLAMANAATLRAHWMKWIGVHALAGLLWLPGFLVLLEQRRNWGASSWLTFSFGDVAPGLAVGLAGGGLAFLLVVFVWLGARNLLRDGEDRPAAILLLCAAFLPVALTILVSALFSPIFLPRTLVPSVLPVLLLAASAFTAMDRRRIPAFATLAALATILLLIPALDHARSDPEEKWPALGAWLAPRVGPSEELWLLPNEIALPFRYGAGPTRYAFRGIPADFPAPDHPGPRPSGSRAVVAMTSADARRLVTDARRRGLTGIWIVTRFPRLFDPGRTIQAAFAEESRDVRDLRFAPLIVDHYRL